MTYEAHLRLYTRDNSFEAWEQWGYVKEIVAVCTLNDVVEVFLIRRDRRWLKMFSPCVDTFILTVQLPSVETGRKMGQKEFDTLDEAIEYGKAFVKSIIFPEAVK